MILHKYQITADSTSDDVYTSRELLKQNRNWSSIPCTPIILDFESQQIGGVMITVLKAALHVSGNHVARFWSQWYPEVLDFDF